MCVKLATLFTTFGTSEETLLKGSGTKKAALFNLYYTSCYKTASFRINYIAESFAVKLYG